MMMAMIPIAPIVYDFSLPFRVGMCRMVGLGDQRAVGECEGRGTIG